MAYYGEYGGRVLRKFNADKPYIVGAEITAEEAESWPVANRKALFNTHKVEWYGPSADDKKAAVKSAASPELPGAESAVRTNRTRKRGDK